MISRRLYQFSKRLFFLPEITIPQPCLQYSKSIIQSRNLGFTAALSKVRKGDKQKVGFHIWILFSQVNFSLQQTNPDLNIVHASHANNPIVNEAIKEMEQLEKILDEELAKHFSAKVDLRIYEDVLVTLDNGEVPFKLH